MSGILIYSVLFVIIILRMRKQGTAKGNGKSTPVSGQEGSRTANRRPLRTPVASDGHRVPKDQDISCRRFGHNHEEFDTPRYIPHEDPEEGYIVLNGVRMKLSEADAYENRI